MRQIIKTSALLLLAALAVGCGRSDGRMLMVQAIYQERTEEGVSLCLMCADSEPSANAGEAQVKQLAVSGEGATLQAAWRMVEKNTGQKLFLEQCRAWLLGKGAAGRLTDEDAAFWTQQDHGCAGMPVWGVDLAPEDAQTAAEQGEVLLNSLDHQTEQTGQSGTPAYQLTRSLWELPCVSVDEGGVAQFDVLRLYRDGETVLAWDAEQHPLIQWMQGDARRVEIGPADAPVIIQWPAAAWSREDQALVLTLSGTPQQELSARQRAELEGELEAAVDEQLRRTLEAGADVFGVKDRRSLLGGGDELRVKVHLNGTDR